jgi:four helix bundle protein
MKNTDSNPPRSEKNSLKDIIIHTFNFAVTVIQLCVKLDERPGVGRVLMSQILRAGTSVPANIEEAQAAQSKADFVSKMSIALKEAREIHLRLRLLVPANVVPTTDLSSLIQEVDEIKRIIGAIIVSTKRGGTD